MLAQGLAKAPVVPGGIAEAVTATSILAAALVETTAAPVEITVVALGVTAVAVLVATMVAALVVIAVVEVQVAVTNGRDVRHLLIRV